MRFLVLAFLMSFALVSYSQQPKLGAAPDNGQQKKKKSKKSADKGNPNAKIGSQDWGRFTDNGNKSMAEQEQAKQAKKSAAAKK